jgi:uncharacterized protein
MILEGIVTTRNADGSVNIAPMGPKLRLSEDGRPQFDRFLLRPFKTSITFQNIARDRCGVLHVTDDVLLIAKAAVLDHFEPPQLVPAERVAGDVIADCCRFYEFVVEEIDDSSDRSSIEVRVVRDRHVREFFGLNRAKHAVVEAAILATRKHMMSPEVLQADVDRLRPLIDKTGGPREHEAFLLLEQFIAGEPETSR